MPKATKAIRVTEQETAQCILQFGVELLSALSDAKKDMDEETQRLYETGSSAYAHEPRSCPGLMSIEDAAQDTGWYAMAGLAAALRTSMERHDRQLLENHLAYQAKQSELKRTKREASQKRRLEKAAHAQGPTPE